MILAAGKGTRLLPLTESIPKPMILINSEPLIVHQIRWLKRAGIREFVLNVHHLGEQIEASLGSGRHLGVNITYSRETDLLDTGGGIARALEYLGDSPFVVMNGDIWTSFPFASLVARGTESAHLVLHPSIQETRALDFALDGAIVKRFEDPTLHTHTFCGISLLHPNIFRRQRSEVFSLTRDLIFALTAEEMRLLVNRSRAHG